MFASLLSYILCILSLCQLASLVEAVHIPTVPRNHTARYTVPPPHPLLYTSTFTKKHLALLRNETKELFDFAWKSYIQFGFPSDEVAPLTCMPLGPDYEDPTNYYKNDVMGNYSLMLFDNLDTFVVMDDYEGWRNALSLVKEHYQDFSINVTVQVFEVNIRVLGGLLSAHLFASDDSSRFSLPDYDGFLLDLAHDLGTRLLPAYEYTASKGIPLPRVNLKYGLSRYVTENHQRDNCVAGSTIIVEFGLLSRLTGDDRFLQSSVKTLKHVWSKRSELGLLPTSYNPRDGQPMDSFTGIGASVDSFYEYLLKYSVLFGEGDEHHELVYGMWKDSYKALTANSRNEWLYGNVDTKAGFMVSAWVDALMAFWPGLQVLNGDVKDAARYNTLYLKLWNTYGGIPERWTFYRTTQRLPSGVDTFDPIGLEWYPLRPEFIESCYHLYRATKDPLYLQIGQRILQDFREVFIAPCGFAGFQNIKSGERANRMESFALSETLKYLYLLFDEDNLVHSHAFHNGKSLVFSTEAHPLWFNNRMDPRRNKTLKNFGRQGQTQMASSDLGFKALYKLEQTAMPDLGVLGLKTEPFVALHEGSGWCEVPETCPKASEFMSSRLLGWSELYRFDNAYKDVLYKPLFYENDSIPKQIETERGFYNLYSHPRGLQCPREKTTKDYDVVVGPVSKIPLNTMLRVLAVAKEYEGIIFPGDIWMPRLAGTRLQVESLRSGQVDSANIDITTEFVESFHLTTSDAMCPLNPNDHVEWTNVLRLRMVNGHLIGHNSMVWTLPFDATTEKEITVGENGIIFITGYPVENLRVWYGVG
ncbi:glycoside hydrolase family 47 protein [Babjeviella inositovora NRRL Y-12698]|uniref:alpha-1,2-Mannosidase n=1 Tax=Babjeviella inositovora NRRL Y-12698 TaxID=984486 RepID=A0A1E3QP64_9ASCO|nr:glycoside hydrolase family 47 protein [Babjeviella inositovora NRRL Y-12698]ODQ79499.1 glycoside hydrolase family 47 protein [Babjeviella inositovora NRRL Y-12698]